MTEERADNKGTVVSDNGNQKPLVDEKCGLMHFKDFSPANPPTPVHSLVPTLTQIRKF